MKRLTAHVAIEPVHNALNSLALLNDIERKPSIRVAASPRQADQVVVNDWVARTAAALTPEQREANQLIFGSLRGALEPGQGAADMPAYLAALAEAAPTELRDRALASAASDEPALDHRARQLLDDPAALHDLIVTHLRRLWEDGLAVEWQGALQRLHSQVGVFRRRAEPGATAAELYRAFTGRPLPADLLGAPIEADQIILVPSPHNDRYVTAWPAGGTLRVFFGAPPNYPLVMRTSAVGRGELRVWMAPLADETRVHILDLLAQRDELSAQELIAELGISQPSVSRHLKELRPYLFERRGEGASKIYSLNALSLDRAVRGLERLLSSEAAPPEQFETTSEQPAELRRFLDRQGRVTGWPTRERDRRLVMEYLAARFEPGQVYSEKEVNATLLEHMGQFFRDCATVRRALYDYRYMHRERDGSRYWLADQGAVG